MLVMSDLVARAGDPQTADGAASYKAQIVAVATRELKQLGEDPQRYRVRVRERVDASRSLLEAHGIDPSGIWVVEFVPPCETGSVCFGGGFEIYFRHPSTSIVFKTAEQ